MMVPTGDLSKERVQKIIEDVLAWHEKLRREDSEKEEAELLEETPPATAPPRDPRSNSI